MATESHQESLGADFLVEARNQLAASRKLIAHCVSQLDDAQIWHREQDDLNSIGNLLLHLAGNLTQRVESNLGGRPDRRDRPREFTERAMIPGVELMRRFDDAVVIADRALDGLNSRNLEDRKPYTTHAGSVEISALAVIFRTLNHLNGHAQEIVYMTRRQLGGRYQFQSPAGVPKSAK